MASSSTASNWQQREQEAVQKLRESLPQWTGSLDDDAPLPRGTKTRTGVLPESGLTYYWRKNDEPRDRVELVIAVRAGSIDETDDERGLAHVLEHLAFRARTDADGRLEASFHVSDSLTRFLVLADAASPGGVASGWQRDSWVASIREAESLLDLGLPGRTAGHVLFPESWRAGPVRWNRRESRVETRQMWAGLHDWAANDRPHCRRQDRGQASRAVVGHHWVAHAR